MNVAPLPADGSGTPMGKAIQTGIGLLQERRELYKQLGIPYYRPWLILLTDGEPTDDVTRAAAAIRAGLTSVTWPGRLEWLGPDLLLDCAHNTEGAEALAAALDALPRDRRRALVLSIVDGKPAAPMLAALVPRFDVVVATRSPSPRALGAPALAALVRAAVRPGEPVDEVDVAELDDPVAAVAEARRRAGAAGLVVIAGSMFLVGAVRAALLG